MRKTTKTMSQNGEDAKPQHEQAADETLQCSYHLAALPAVRIQPPFVQPAKPRQGCRPPLDLCCAECCGPAVRSYRIELLLGWEEKRHVENLRRHTAGDRSIRRNCAGADDGCSSPQASRGVCGRHDQGRMRMRRQRPLAGLQGR